MLLKLITGFFATSALVGGASLALPDGEHGTCERDVRVIVETGQLILGECRGYCEDPNSTCNPRDAVKQPGGNVEWQCGCVGGVPPFIITACAVIFVQAPNGTQSVECFPGGCEKECYITWTTPVGGISEIHCHCPN